MYFAQPIPIGSWFLDILYFSYKPLVVLLHLVQQKYRKIYLRKYVNNKYSDLDARHYIIYWCSFIFKRQWDLSLPTRLYLPHLTEADFVFKCMSNPHMKLRCACKSHSLAWYSVKVTFQRARTFQLGKLHLSLILPVLICTLFLFPDGGVKE